MLSKTVCSATTSLICGVNTSAKALNKMGQFSNSDLEHRKRVEEALHVSENDLRLVIDMRGTIYAIYRFSEEQPGIDPFYYGQSAL